MIEKQSRWMLTSTPSRSFSLENGQRFFRDYAIPETWALYPTVLVHQTSALKALSALISFAQDPYLFF